MSTDEHQRAVIEAQRKLIEALELRWDQNFHPVQELEGDHPIDCDCVDDEDIQRLKDRLEWTEARAVGAGVHP